MEILKWYSIIILSIGTLLDLIGIIIAPDVSKRVSNLLSIILKVPILIYIILR